MHELSIVTELVRVACEKAAEAGISRLDTVEVEVGELTALVPDLMRFSFEQITSDTTCAGAVLMVRVIPLEVRCRRCGLEYHPEDPILAMCPGCGGLEVDIIRGTETNLVRLEGD